MFIDKPAVRVLSTAATAGAMAFAASYHLVLPIGKGAVTPPSAGMSQMFSLQASEIGTGPLARRMADRVPRLLIVDIRSPAEYAVSHIPGAVSVDLGRPVEAVLAQIAHLARGNTVVVTCSLGVRSAIAAELLKLRLEDLGALDVVTLKGGVIAWANDGRWLRDINDRLTASVHPGDDSLVGTVRRASLVRLTPHHSGP